MVETACGRTRRDRAIPAITDARVFVDNQIWYAEIAQLCSECETGLAATDNQYKRPIIRHGCRVSINVSQRCKQGMATPVAKPQMTAPATKLCEKAKKTLCGIGRAIECKTVSTGSNAISACKIRDG